MKISIFTLSLTFLTALIGFQTLSQVKSGNVIYKVKANAPVNKDADEKVKDFIKKSDENLKNVEFLLKFNDQESIFEPVEKMAPDQNEYFYKMALASTGASKKRWYVNINDNLQLLQYNFMGTHFRITDDLNHLNWQITNDNKNINGYKAFKATCEIKKLGGKGPVTQKLEVWFSPEISVSHGPMGLAGLPGLILEVNSGRITFYTSNIKLNQKSVIAIKKPSQGKLMNSEDFYEFAGAAVKDFTESN